MDPAHRLGENVRRAREALGMTRKHLAEQAGLASGEAILKIEMGKGNIKAWQLSKLAIALGVDFQELLSSELLEYGPLPRWCPLGRRQRRADTMG